MGIMSFFKEMLSEDKNREENYEELNQSIIMEIAKMKSKILLMQQFYPEKAREIETKIQSLEQYIGDVYKIEVEEQQYINEKFSDIKENFQSFSKISEEKFLFSEAKRAFKGLDKIFRGEEELNENKISQFEEMLKLLDEKKTELSGIKQQQYIKELIDAKYRLRCCRIMLYDANYFADAPKVERIFYANSFTKDIRRYV